LGATESIKADVRVVAASNRNLDELVSQGIFRQDLYYRVNVVKIVLPPLCQRKEDVPLLAEHFITRFNCLRGRQIAGVSSAAMAALMEYDYPGNIRELENIIEHAFVLCDGAKIETRHLPEHLAQTGPPPSEETGFPSALGEFEKRLICEALERNGFNRLAAARELGIHKSTLFRKIKSLGIVLPAVDGRSAGSKSRQSATARAG
ncbi:MAG: helix-turn-helix domain-containing protein, partial [Gemmatimonadota bacterium]|nr:helix-turn-helix domain-containing protein [Gemmatimonadota bacterium]